MPGEETIIGDQETKKFHSAESQEFIGRLNGVSGRAVGCNVSSIKSGVGFER